MRFLALLFAFSSANAAIVSFEATPNPITPGQEVTISWNATDASWCDLMHVESGARQRLPDISGSLTTSDIAETSRLRLICKKLGETGSWRETITVTVESAPDPDPEPDPEPDPDPPPPSEASCDALNRGIPDPCSHFGYDIFATHEVDQVVTGTHTQVTELNGSGTPANPYVIDARGATFTRQWGVTGQYVILIGGKGQAPSGGGPWFALQCNYCVAIDVEIDGPGVASGNSTAVYLSSNTAWVGGSIHGFGSVTSSTENDYHGIKPTNVSDIWIIDLESYDMSGDSVQVGNATGGIASRIYISGGYMHDNRENAVDIKSSRDVVVSGVRMEGFQPTGSSNGVALVLHNDARDGRVLDNFISDSQIGIVSSGFSGHVINGNVIQALLGIDLRSTSNLTVTENSITAQQCIRKASSATGTIQTGCQ